MTDSSDDAVRDADGGPETVSRRDHELALRRTNLTIANLRDQLLQLGAQVATLTDALDKRDVIDDDEVTASLAENVRGVRRSDQTSNPLRLALGESLVDKYAAESPPIPCDELMPICKARCCKLEFALTTQDLNEVKVRWNYARPYFILQREDGYCVHNDATSNGCQLYDCRPAPCRKFDCRQDKRIWLDFDKRLIAPESAIDDLPDSADDRAEIDEELRQNQVAQTIEELALAAAREDS